MRDFGNVPLIADVTRERVGMAAHGEFCAGLALCVADSATGPELHDCRGVDSGVRNWSERSGVQRGEHIITSTAAVQISQRLAWLAGGNGAGGLSVVTYRADAYDAFRDHNRSFEKVTGFCPFYSYSSFNLTGHGDPQPVAGVWVLGDFFSTLGVQPILGRDFTAEEAAGQTAGDVELRILADPISRRSIHRWQNDWIGWRTGDGRRRLSQTLCRWSTAAHGACM